jgi:hypothetical protein
VGWRIILKRISEKRFATAELCDDDDIPLGFHKDEEISD